MQEDSMKIMTWIPVLGLVFCAVFSFSAEKPETPKAGYVGAKKCKMCHNSKAKGAQYDKWMADPHYKAYETLKTPKSLEVAKKAGIKDPLADAKCLKCHMTADTIKAEGVSCESCHGAGSLYWKAAVMKDKVKAAENGLIEPDEKLCKTCHNPESPTYKKFVFAEAVKVVEHPNPQKQKK